MLEYYLSKIIKKAHFRAIKNSIIDKNAGVCAGTQIVDSTVGRYSDIGYDCVIINTILGNFCSLGANIRIGGASHPIVYVSTSTVFLRNKDHIKKKFASHSFESSKQTIIGNDVWIADGVYIKAGITVNTGAVIGMGSVVTKDVGAYEIWAGNPAKKIGDRFDEQTKCELLESKWWDYSEEELLHYGQWFSNVEEYLNQVN